LELHELARDEAADPEARHTAAEALARAGAYRRERHGLSPMFVWMAALTAVVVVLGAATIAGPVAALIVAAAVVALGVYKVRRRGGGEGGDVYLGPQGERIHLPIGPPS
jgi:hypothetical protein